MAVLYLFIKKYIYLNTNTYNIRIYPVDHKFVVFANSADKFLNLTTYDHIPKSLAICILHGNPIFDTFKFSSGNHISNARKPCVSPSLKLSYVTFEIWISCRRNAFFSIFTLKKMHFNIF